MRFSLRTLLSLFVTLCASIGQSHAAELMYVRNGNQINTFDVSLSTATDVLNSKQTIINGGLGTYGGLTVDGAGNIYAVDYNANNVKKINSIGSIVATIGSSSNLSGPSYAGINSAGTLLVPNAGRVTQFDSSGVFQGNANISVYGITFDNSGNMFGADPFSNVVKKYDSGFNLIGTIGSATNLSSPRQPALDSLGNMYVATYSNNIALFNSAGVFQRNIGSGLQYMESIAVDSAGYIYAPNGQGSINKYDSLGNLIFSWNTPGGGTNFLAFAPNSVPEPSTYALAAIASSVIAFAARRRKGLTSR